MKWTPSKGPKFRKEPYVGICPEFHKRAEILALYEGRQLDPRDIILTYCLQSYDCSLVEPGKHCPHIKPCPFVEQRRYY